ncbi:hypothetical protein F4802DRAFT_333154 [Xylaria palmicola]|nr:hypothetical protein F4802DRAFT_333154 [Xylaria palmicola]
MLQSSPIRPRQCCALRRVRATRGGWRDVSQPHARLPVTISGPIRCTCVYLPSCAVIDPLARATLFTPVQRRMQRWLLTRRHGRSSQLLLSAHGGATVRLVDPRTQTSRDGRRTAFSGSECQPRLVNSVARDILHAFPGRIMRILHSRFSRICGRYGRNTHNGS